MAEATVHRLSAWDDLLEPEPEPPPPPRRSPLRPGPLGLLVWVLVTAVAGVAGGIWWHGQAEEVVTVSTNALSTLAPGLDAAQQEAWATAQVAGLTRPDGTSYGEWVKAQLADAHCPASATSSWTWLVHTDGEGPTTSFRVGLRRFSDTPGVCTTDWDRVWIGQVAAADGVVRTIRCTPDLAPPCPAIVEDGPLGDGAVNGVVSWLDEFVSGAA